MVNMWFTIIQCKNDEKKEWVKTTILELTTYCILSLHNLETNTDKIINTHNYFY
jgi:hypothetical protein